MAKRELSSTLKNLKFMQRTSKKEEKPKEEAKVLPSGDFPSFNAPKRCTVIVEGDPDPGVTQGRMSFLSFNPSIDKLNKEKIDHRQPEASATRSCMETEAMSSRENGSLQGEPEELESGSSSGDSNGDLKRKQADVVSEELYPNKLHKTKQGNSSRSSSFSMQKQKKREKLDWRVLRSPNKKN